MRERRFSFLDHYPGDWQDVLPGAGGPSEGDGGAPLTLHGESSLVPWEAHIVEDTAERVAVALTDLDSGRYTLTNPDIGLGVTVRFPADRYEYLWYWRPLGGFESAPFFGRTDNVGLEPCTSAPNAGLQESKANGTARFLDPGETESATISFGVHPAGEDRLFQ